MRQIQPDLWETEVESPIPGLTTHAYLFTRAGGNVLFYNTGHEHEIDKMAELGGVAYHFLSHRDELGDSVKRVRERFGARLGGHAREQADFAQVCPPDILFQEPETHLGAIDVIPTPGHSPGSTCFLVRSSHGTYLFTGDTVYLGDDGRWKAGFLDGISDREALADSLGVLRALEPDVVLSSAFGGDAGFQRMRPSEWADHVRNALEELRR